MTAIRAIKVGYNENKSFSKNIIEWKIRLIIILKEIKNVKYDSVETLFFIYPQASYLYKNI